MCSECFLMKLKASLTHAMGEEVEPGAGPLPQLDVDGPAELEGGDEEGEPALAVALAAVGEGRERQEGRAHEDELQGARQSHQVRGLWARVRGSTGHSAWYSCMPFRLRTRRH